MGIRRQTTTTGPPTEECVLDPFTVGSYLTRDGALLGIVGELPQEPVLLLVEDCHTLEITVVSADVLREQGALPVAR